MNKVRFIMNMPVEINIPSATNLKVFDLAFDYFRYIDKKFSTYKKNSEVSRFNAGKINKADLSKDFNTVYKNCIKYSKNTNGYFNAYNENKYFDPSGFVKGWSIYNASMIIAKAGHKKYFVGVGGDIQTKGNDWKVGIRNPFDKDKIVKVVKINGKGIATSGNYERGMHIYNPNDGYKKADMIKSITVIADNVYVADVYATAAFAMGLNGINYIERLKNCEGYQIGKNGIATETSGFYKYVC